MDGRRPCGDLARLLNLPARASDTAIPRSSELNQESFVSGLKEYSPGVWVLTDSSGRMSWETLSSLLEIAATRADYVLVDFGPFFFWQDPPLVRVGQGINLCVLTPDSAAIEQAARIKESLRVQERHVWFILNRGSGTVRGKKQ